MFSFKHHQKTSETLNNRVFFKIVALLPKMQWHIKSFFFQKIFLKCTEYMCVEFVTRANPGSKESSLINEDTKLQENAMFWCLMFIYVGLQNSVYTHHRNKHFKISYHTVITIRWDLVESKLMLYLIFCPTFQLLWLLLLSFCWYCW